MILNSLVDHSIVITQLGFGPHLSGALKSSIHDNLSGKADVFAFSLVICNICELSKYGNGPRVSTQATCKPVSGKLDDVGGGSA